MYVLFLLPIGMIIGNEKQNVVLIFVNSQAGSDKVYDDLPFKTFKQEYRRIFDEDVYKGTLEQVYRRYVKYVKVNKTISVGALITGSIGIIFIQSGIASNNVELAIAGSGIALCSGGILLIDLPFLIASIVKKNRWKKRIHQKKSQLKVGVKMNGMMLVYSF